MILHCPRRLIATIVLAVTVACCSACSNSPDDRQSQSPRVDSDAKPHSKPSDSSSALLAYEIIKREEVPINKLVYRLRLDFIDGNRLPAEDDLAAISHHLKQSNPGFESVFVYCYMRGYDSDRHQPFAGAHHILDGKMKVDIHTQPIPPSGETEKYGLTESQRKQLYHNLIALDRESLDWENDDRLESERLHIFKKYGIQKNLYWEIADESSKRAQPVSRSSASVRFLGVFA